ncbi:MAG: hypothetical protein IPM04_12640 [Saprospiraceae bacterium]|nr:hypothetical protein [Candidatus Brachybacter algidus]MBK8748673.1 hypothetical protein [Candidatus Brachybacter algidus]
MIIVQLQSVPGVAVEKVRSCLSNDYSCGGTLNICYSNRGYSIFRDLKDSASEIVMELLSLMQRPADEVPMVQCLILTVQLQELIFLRFYEFGLTTNGTFGIYVQQSLAVLL